LSDVQLNDALSAAGIDSKRRAETMSISEFGHLSNILKIKKDNLR
jgi:16S rRNA A1518/A1519 N6-dimethyltransferase RsmA/KsgA/DIM1 with predicted DNA glycosylase/AP lyase activity